MTKESGEKILTEGSADMISYGRLALANPDLPEKFEKDIPLYLHTNVEPKEFPRLFYGPGPEATEGYTDLSMFAPPKL